MKALRERKYLVLFLVLVVVLGLQPLAQGPVGALIVFDVLGFLVVMSVFLVVFERWAQRLVALVGALLALASDCAAYVVRDEAHVGLLLLYHAGVGLFLAFAVVMILRGIFKNRVLRTDDVIGGLCGYLLAGLVWANLYGFIEALAPGSFSVKPDVAWELTLRHPRRFLFTYYSFVTLTSLGSGDLTPASPAASWFVCLESMFGQFYVAIVVAQMVGLKLAQATRSEEEGRPDR
jgi:hypothetical protein